MVIIPWKYNKSVFFYIFKPGPPIVEMFFNKIATYDKIKFPQQANSMVGGTRRNCAYDNFFLQIKPKIILILIQPRHKEQNLIFFKKVDIRQNRTNLTKNLKEILMTRYRKYSQKYIRLEERPWVTKGFFYFVEITR